MSNMLERVFSQEYYVHNRIEDHSLQEMTTSNRQHVKSHSTDQQSDVISSYDAAGNNAAYSYWS